MDAKAFKKIVNDVFLSKGMSKNGSYFYSETEEITVVVGLQKSNFSNGYYINVGYIIRQLNSAVTIPKDVDGDIRTRFGFDKGGNEVDLFDLDYFPGSNEQVLKSILEDNIAKYILPIKSTETLKILINEKPVLLYQTKLLAKQLLGFE